MRYLPYRLLCLLPLLAFSGADTERAWRVHTDSLVVIKGRSNVNQFVCDAPRYQGTDTLRIRRMASGEAQFVKGRVQLGVQLFDCHNRLMTQDFRKTLLAEQHPAITIQFHQLNRYPDLSSGCESLWANVNIVLAGVSKPYRLPCRMEADTRGITHLYGEHTMLFSDFGLTPPSKMMGLIQVHDELQVSFHLQLQ